MAERPGHGKARHRRRTALFSGIPLALAAAGAVAYGTAFGVFGQDMEPKAAAVPSSASAYPGPGRVTGDVVVHDPTMLRAPDGGKDLLVYHYYDGRDGGAPKLGLNLLEWSGGWPSAY
ncbi:hypothetical protein GCM10010249_42280 [Streptomyces roseolilacinus]|uniref:Uncharacterized protein n=1 Tax=Streptomyces roseolilacinus TaxID=66904 RepID=A0A918B637_9ACTN|nr:hypothetical protein GCM10010249_42280 [Streptomyces roseolilacinus]